MQQVVPDYLSCVAERSYLHLNEIAVVLSGRHVHALPTRHVHALYAMVMSTEAAVAAASAAPRVVLLSGTPSLSRPYDLFRQVDVLQPGILGRTKEEFAHR